MLRTTRTLLYLFFVASFLLAVPARAASRSTLTDTETLTRQLLATGLPLVVVDTDDGTDPPFTKVLTPPEGCWGNGVTNTTKKNGRILLIQQSDTLYDSGAFEKGKSGMKIHVRGNSSNYYAVYPSYKVKLQKKFDLLQRGDSIYRDKDWVLLGEMSSLTLKFFIGTAVGRLVGLDYEPRGFFVNLLLNGKYAGIYILAENVKRAPTRCDVEKDGFIIENDSYYWNGDDPYFQGKYLNKGVGYTYKYPDEDDATPEQYAYIAERINEFEDALYNDFDISSYIDISSFASWLIGHDLLGTYDAAGSNMFITKRDAADSPLCMGPMWDFDSAFRCSDSYAIIHHANYFYYQKLFTRPAFLRAYKERWEAIKDTVETYMQHEVDSLVTAQGEAVNKSRILFNQYFYQSYPNVESNVQESEQWFSNRVAFLDSLISASYTSGINKVVTDPVSTSVTVYDVFGRMQGIYPLSKEGSDWRHNCPKGVYVVRYLNKCEETVRTEKVIVK